MANPFLMSDADLGDTQVSSTGSSFNPFLAGNDFGNANYSDNPFMNVFSSGTTSTTDSSSTNPFAFSSAEETVTTDFFGSASVSESTEINYDNIFSSPSQNTNFESTFQVNSAPTINQNESFLMNDEPLLTSEPSNNGTDLFGTEMSDQMLGEESGGDSSKSGPPRRPPPPRPIPPKETKDLILSVTGAMEATSSHLLDRLQATRTPSPTPMRDLHSPSPTQFGDLLEVDEPEGEVTEPTQAPSEPQELNFLGDFDFPAPAPQVPSNEFAVPTQTNNEPVPLMDSISEMTTTTNGTVTMAPSILPSSRPALPSRPKPPPTPSRPPPPALPQPVIPPEIEPIKTQVEAEPAPPPQEIVQDSNDGFADVFGSEPVVNVTEQEKNETNIQPNIFDMPEMKDSAFAETNIEPSNITNITAIEENANIPSQDIFAPNSNQPTQDIFSSAINTTSHDGFYTNTSAVNQDIFSSSLNQTTNDVFSSNVNQTSGDMFTSSTATQDIFTSSEYNSINEDVQQTPASNAFSLFATAGSNTNQIQNVDEFDAFTAKFENAGFGETKSDPFDPFGSSSAFGQAPTIAAPSSLGFEGDDNFDSFLAIRETPAPPQSTPAKLSRADSADSDAGNDFNVFIKPKTSDEMNVTPDIGSFAPLAPPPKSPVQPLTLQDTSPRFNPFDSNQEIPSAAAENIFAQVVSDINESRTMERTDSHETPPTPLFDEDVSQPLEDFPRVVYEGPGWEMQLRQPNKKKITGQRFWKKIFLKIVYQGENPVLQLFSGKDDKDPFQELPLQPCYSVSEIAAQQFDQYGKIFTIKLQFIFYKERPGVRPGQVTKAERITNKLSQFAAYAIQGDYQGVKEFGSDLKKLGLPVEHAPQISQLFKIGSHNYEDMKQFSMCVEEALFRLSAHRDRALNYKMEEVQITAVDELYVEQNNNGGVEKQIARVRLFFLAFLSGMPDVELGVNDLVRQGKEVVGRHDIIPVVTEEWIRLEGVEFHSCIQQDEYERTRTIRFKPPDACYIELMRFRIRPPKNRELPLQLKCTICVTGNKVEIRTDILVPGFTSRKLGQIPCEDVMVRIPIPECWIYLFRVEKHFRYGSVKSAHRRTGKVKGIERILGAIDNLETSLMEVTSGQAKYEHAHRSIVWRMPRLPKEGQGAYTTHNLVCRMTLTSFDQIPDELAKYCYVEFTMPATTVSHTTVRSVSIANSDSDSPPEKYVRQLSRHEYRIEIEHTQGEGPGDYIAATVSKPAPPTIAEEPPQAPTPAAPDSDSDSSG